MFGYVICAILLFIYAYKERNNAEKFIKYPIVLGVLTLFFVLFLHFDYKIAEKIVSVVILILVVWSFVADRKKKLDK